MKYGLLFSVLLVGCATDAPHVPPPDVIVKDKVIIMTVPETMTSLPQPPVKIDPEKSTQKDVASWINSAEEYMRALEIKLKAIRLFSDDAKTKNEVK